MTSTEDRLRSRPPAVRDVVMIGLAVLLVPVGVLLTPRVLTQDTPGPHNVVQAGFGDVEVLAVQRNHGAMWQPAADGPARSVPAGVASNAGEMVGLELEVAGRGRDGVVSFADFALVADGRPGVAVVSGTIGGAHLRGHARVDGSLSFRVPRNSRVLVLEVREGSVVRRLALAPVATSGGTAPAL